MGSMECFVDDDCEWFRWHKDAIPRGLVAILAALAFGIFPCLGLCCIKFCPQDGAQRERQEGIPVRKQENRQIVSGHCVEEEEKKNMLNGIKQEVEGQIDEDDDELPQYEAQ